VPLAALNESLPVVSVSVTAVGVPSVGTSSAAAIETVSVALPVAAPSEAVTE
jgi:hypothetical protein